MRSLKLVLTILALLAVLALAPWVSAAQEHTLDFKPTQNAPAGISGTMTIEVKSGQTKARFRLNGGYPDTVYTIWIVYNVLQLANPLANSMEATERPGFPPEGNGVAPLGRLDAAFTSGMGMDPGASFVTDDHGNGDVDVELDYDLIRAAPVANSDVILQCAPAATNCLKQIRVTTTWLRRYIGEFPLVHRPRLCANYDARFDKESGVYDPVLSKGTDARFWQCINPDTGLPRVHRYTFDHFRLANHPDDLTHGFIGGDKVDHWIDMVGRRCDLVPPVGPACP